MFASLIIEDCLMLFQRKMAVNILPKRYVLSGMIFIGFFVMSGLRVNLNVAIGAMVNNHTAVMDGEIICRVSEDSTSEKTRSWNT